LNHLYEAQKEANTQKNVIKMHPRRWYWAAASVVAVLAIGATLLFSVPSHTSNDALFKQYYSSENILDVTRSGDANLVEAIMKFQEKDFKTAAWMFGKILAKDESNMAVWFYYGISSIETQNYETANNAFTRIINDKQNLYIEHAEWYLSLCYLKSNQTDKAVDQLNKIAKDENNYHQQEALTLLNKISKN
jgi:tetratricopeptide (TPR) repeat protein